MHRVMILAVLLIAIGLTAFFVFAPGMVERDMNRVEGPPLPPLREDARELHARLAIADLHGDTLLWKRDMTEAATRGHIDLPRLQTGNVALQVFSSVTKTPRNQNYDANSADSDNITLLAIGQLQPVRTWTSLIERSLWHAEKLEKTVSRSQGKLILIRSPDDIIGLFAERLSAPHLTGKPFTGRWNATPVGALLSIEGLHNLEGKRANLDRLYEAGFRMAGLMHFFDNELGGSMHGVAKGGLTPFGRAIVRAMEDKGMIVDIAHASHAAVADILKIARRPVVSSHGGVQATCKVNRNLTDDEIRGVAATGGVIGIGYWDAAVCDISPKGIARAIAHVRDLVGIDHVGLGSDFDGSVTTAFDTAGLAHVTQALIDEGFSEEEIAKVMGGNVLRLLSQGLAPMGAALPPVRGDI